MDVNKLVILTVLIGMVGCAPTKMSAKAKCDFEADKVNGTYYHWIEPGKTNCMFILESPIGKSRDVVEFASAFYLMFQAVPSSGTATVIVNNGGHNGRE